jgi:tetratricopeptide (TPR) repeat protein
MAETAGQEWSNLYTSALEISPQYAAAYNSRAWTYLKAGKPAKGLPDAERALQLRPDHAGSLDTRGHIFEALGRREEARANDRQAEPPARFELSSTSFTATGMASMS